MAPSSAKLFTSQKQKYLEGLAKTEKDRSKKGDVDDAIRPLLDAINACAEYYTTSSCAGRIDLFVEPASGKKHEGQWLYVSHDEADEDEVRKALTSLPEDASGTVWFRMEGAILHVCAANLDAADQFLKQCKAAGWKHSGVTGTSPRIMIEATTSERIDVPVAKDDSLFVPEKFIAYLMKEANRKLERTRKKIKRLEKTFL